MLLNVASNAEVSRIEQTEAELQYRANGQQVANIGYQYADGLLPADRRRRPPGRCCQRWDIYARAVYSLLDHASIEDFAGFQYRSDCWGMRVLWQRSVSHPHR